MLRRTYLEGMATSTDSIQRFRILLDRRVMSYSAELFGSSKVSTWTTPRAFFDSLNQEFGFGLDAAALQSSALCDKWYGPDHPDESMRDAFTREWHKDCDGKPIWLNPPYGRTIGQWVAKANDECKHGATVVLLVPSRTDTSWWHENIMGHTIRFVRGRLKFGDGKNDAPFPNAVVIMEGK